MKKNKRQQRALSRLANARHKEQERETRKFYYATSGGILMDTLFAFIRPVQGHAEIGFCTCHSYHRARYCAEVDTERYLNFIGPTVHVP